MADLPDDDSRSNITKLRRCVIFDFDDTLAIAEGEPTSDVTELFGGPERILLLAELFAELRQSSIVLGVVSYNMRLVFEPLLRSAGLLSFFEQSLLFGEEIFDEGGPLSDLITNSSGPFQPGWTDKGAVISRLVLPHIILPVAQILPAGSAIITEHESPRSQRHARRALTAPFLPCRGVVDASADGSSSILFVDDLTDNVVDVHNACACCATLLVPSEGGMRPAQLAAIRGWATSSHASPGAADKPAARGEVAETTAARSPGEMV